MSLRSRSNVKASMVLTRADHLFIHNYIRSLLNNILSAHFIKLINGPDEGRTRVLAACVSDALATTPYRQFIYIYDYLYRCPT